MKKRFAFTKNHARLVAVLLLLLILCNGKFFYTSPFGVSFAFALVINNFYAPVVSIFYFFSSIVYNLSFVGLVDSALGSSLLIILYIIQKASKKNNIYLGLLFCALSRVANIYFNFTNLLDTLYSLLDLLISVGFCFVAQTIVKAFLFRGIQCLTKLEKSFFCILIIAIFSGITNIELYINVSKTLFILIILLSSLALGYKTIYVASFISVAMVISFSSLADTSMYFIYACLALWISPYNKFLSVSVVCLVDSVYGLFIDYSLVSLIPVLLASIIFLAIPKRIILYIHQYISGSKHSIISSYYVNKKQDIIKHKLTDMSSLFKQMQRCYRDLLMGESNKEKVVSLLASELKTNLCENCINKLGCLDKNLSPCFEELIVKAQKKGKVNLLDVPLQLSSNCTKVNACLSNINQMAEEYIKQAKQAQSEDDGKLNISLQLGGTSKIFAELSNQFVNPEKVNTKKSKQIKDCLHSSGLICKECMVTEKDNAVAEIILVVRNADAVNPNLIKSCEKVYPIKFERKICVQTKIAGWSLVCLTPTNRYELVCGYASTPKHLRDKSGDNYVYTKLTDSKYLVAICDGMGHGENANNISTVAINLIESYYKCGLSSQIVIDSVNNMLLPAGSGSTFTTLDATIVDTTTGEVDFIKIGSSISIVKQIEQSSIIGVESLPLGVIESVSPTTHKVALQTGDIVVLVSDGIVDTFSSQEEFCNFVNNENIINMQMFAESILEEAVNRHSQNKDDMTVIAYRIIQKR